MIYCLTFLGTDLVWDLSFRVLRSLLVTHFSG